MRYNRLKKNFDFQYTNLELSTFFFESVENDARDERAPVVFS